MSKTSKAILRMLCLIEDMIFFMDNIRVKCVQLNSVVKVNFTTDGCSAVIVFFSSPGLG